MYFLPSLSILLDQRALRLVCTRVTPHFSTRETLREGKQVLQLRLREAHCL